jgi:hypothetical protein
MNRRESIQAGVTLFFAGFCGGNAFLTAAKSTESRIVFSKEQKYILEEMAEIIIPATPKSLGAKAADIATFMQSIVSDCYSLEEQKVFMEGLNQIPKDFHRFSAQKKWDFVLDLDTTAGQTNNPEVQPHYFTMIKQLTTWGYFTSEVGLTQELGYNPIPGKYVGCMNYEL